MKRSTSNWRSDVEEYEQANQTYLNEYPFYMTANNEIAQYFFCPLRLASFEYVNLKDFCNDDFLTTTLHFKCKSGSCKRSPSISISINEPLSNVLRGDQNAVDISKAFNDKKSYMYEDVILLNFMACLPNVPTELVLKIHDYYLWCTKLYSLKYDLSYSFHFFKRKHEMKGCTPLKDKNQYEEYLRCRVLLKDLQQ